jgi:hypothetical protein
VDAVHVPSERSDVGHQRVRKRPSRIRTVQENVPNKRDIHGKPPNFIGKLKLVSVEDVSVEIGFEVRCGFS